MAASLARLALTAANRSHVIRSSRGAGSGEVGLPGAEADNPAGAVAPNALLAGQVTVYDGASVWNGAVLRGDLNKITVGFCSNVQEKCVLHAAWTSPTGSGLSVFRVLKRHLRDIVQENDKYLTLLTKGT